MKKYKYTDNDTGLAYEFSFYTNQLDGSIMLRVCFANSFISSTIQMNEKNIPWGQLWSPVSIKAKHHIKRIYKLIAFD